MNKPHVTAELWAKILRCRDAIEQVRNKKVAREYMRNINLEYDFCNLKESHTPRGVLGSSFNWGKCLAWHHPIFWLYICNDLENL